MSATNRGAIRNANDYYPTPAPAIDRLLEVLDLRRVASFLEPCKGESAAIYNRVDDVLCKDWCELSEGRDYLSYDADGIFDLIITNPPFSLALEFLRKSLTEADCVIYLLRLNFLESRKRRAFWRANPPTHLLALAERPCFTGDGRTDATGYGWFCWDKRGFVKLPPGVHVL